MSHLDNAHYHCTSDLEVTYLETLWRSSTVEQNRGQRLCTEVCELDLEGSALIEAHQLLGTCM